jgi:hypothetical protein
VLVLRCPLSPLPPPRELSSRTAADSAAALSSSPSALPPPTAAGRRRHPMAPTGRLLAVAALSFLCECLPPRDLPPLLLILSISCSYFPCFLLPKCEFQQLRWALDSRFFSLPVPDDPPFPALCFVGFDLSGAFISHCHCLGANSPCRQESPLISVFPG